MLRALIKGSTSEEDFFPSIYQNVPKVFASNDEQRQHQQHSHVKETTAKMNDTNLEDKKNSIRTGNMNNSNKKSKIESSESENHHDLFNKIISMTVNDISNILETSRCTFGLNSSNAKNIPTPLFFKERKALSADEMENLYNSNPLAAYIDGCSIILNHLELLKEETIGKLCKELAKNPSFPHCFANGYLTPASSQAVPPHADDRDVFVLQVFGQKNWTVYGDVPIPFPYHHEQVGKNDIPVPESILTKKPLIERTLVPGDVLYMPRGYVHEACTVSNKEASFHITIALPTHDWTYSNIFTLASRQLLDQDVSLRKAIVPSHDSVELEQNIQQMITILQQNINSKSLTDLLHQSSKLHEEKSMQISQLLSSQMLQITSLNTDARIGYEAIHLIQFSSTIRAATQEERSSIIEKEKSSSSAKPRGLSTRVETGDVLFTILQYIKSNPNDRFVISELHSLPCCGCKCYNEKGGNGVLDHDVCILDDLSILCFIKCCVEFGAIVLVSP